MLEKLRSDYFGPWAFPFFKALTLSFSSMMVRSFSISLLGPIFLRWFATFTLSLSSGLLCWFARAYLCIFLYKCVCLRLWGCPPFAPIKHDAGVVLWSLHLHLFDYTPCSIYVLFIPDPFKLFPPGLPLRQDGLFLQFAAYVRPLSPSPSHISSSSISSSLQLLDLLIHPRDHLLPYDFGGGHILYYVLHERC